MRGVVQDGPPSGQAAAVLTAGTASSAPVKVRPRNRGGGDREVTARPGSESWDVVDRGRARHPGRHVVEEAATLPAEKRNVYGGSQDSVTDRAAHAAQKRRLGAALSVTVRMPCLQPFLHHAMSP